jgi:hypothetical protein
MKYGRIIFPGKIFLGNIIAKSKGKGDKLFKLLACPLIFLRPI